MWCEPVIVVGATPDYVRKIYNKYPASVLFVLDLRFQGDPFLEGIEKSALLFSSLEDFEQTMHVVDLNLSTNNLSPQGVACFDCESLIPAARLAHHLRLPFPSLKAIVHARNKFEARNLWKKADILTPAAAIASNVNETLDFFHCIKRTIVLKPISGSGSELLFRCRNEEEIRESVQVMEEQLPRRKSNPLFKSIPSISGAAPVDPCKTWVAEEFIQGPEFSYDFILQDGQVQILRETGKIKASEQTFGSILAYTFPPSYPKGFSPEIFSDMLKRATKSLGYNWGYFMVDFIICHDQPTIIEISPRPGGDSIPDLIEIATGHDLIGAYLDFSTGRCPSFKRVNTYSNSFVSINIYAPGKGTITYLDASQILSQAWVKALFLKKSVGDFVTLPPDDYDNRLLGYCVIKPEPGWDPITLYHNLQKLIKIRIES